MSTAWWRNTCRIGSFVIPYVPGGNYPPMKRGFMTNSGLEYDTYDNTGLSYKSGELLGVKYRLRPSKAPTKDKAE